MDLLIHCFGLSFIFGLLLVMYLKKQNKSKSVCVVVLGDIGRSPRMQYHALSFLKAGFSVEMVGYPGSKPLKQLQDNPNFKIHYLPVISDFKDRWCITVAYGLKTIYQSIFLLHTLFTKCDSSILILQNPPGIPTIPICWFYCRLIYVHFVIDWHNYANSIMALSSGENNILVQIASYVEYSFGARADNNFCVTESMQEDLKKNWNITANTLYDRPSEEFCSISLEDKHNLILKLSQDYEILQGRDNYCTLFTKCSNDKNVELLNDRPGLLISSTSWTEDEDFSILVDALNAYNNEIELNKGQYAELICIITGKGPLKDFYREIISNKQWKHVKIIMPWLESEDYPKLLACADLGVCLHKSSSGLDLPMKVVDMFGCGLPVCAYDFKCLHELVKHNENGLTFKNEEELFTHLKFWFKNFPNNNEQINLQKKFKKQLEQFQEQRWHSNWMEVVLPIFANLE